MSEIPSKIQIVRSSRLSPRNGVLHASKLKGASPDLSAATYQIYDESHTIGNALRWMIMKK